MGEFHLFGVIVNVTTLGSRGGSSGSSVGKIVNYLEGNAPNDDRRASRAGSAAAVADPAAGPGNYYADSGAGRWLGAGAGAAGWDLGEVVQREPFERLLLGQDPRTGEQVMHASGVSKRATHTPAVTDAGTRGEVPSELSSGGGEWVRLADLAANAQMDASYLRKTARDTAKRIEEHDPATGELQHPTTYLMATKAAGEWWVERGEADRYLAARSPQAVVHAYDMTFSVPKSVSVLWAASTPAIQSEIEDALSSAVSDAMTYIEDHGFWVRQGRGQTNGDGMVAAAYRHHTSRALEPQLHDHVVVANMASDPSKAGGVRAVDARGLISHATPAGHLANAALRRELTERLGVVWSTPERGRIAEIEGVPAAAIRAMSTRRAELIDLAEEVGAFTVHGRQMAALATRAGKDIGVDEAELRRTWRETLTDHGLDPQTAAELAPGPRSRRAVDVGELFRELSDLERGVVGERAVFDRRHVIAWIADIAGDGLTSERIGALADQWLAERAVPLEVSNTWDTIANRSGARVSISHGPQYSTPEMVALEQRVKAIHRHGLNRSPVVVAPAAVERSIRRLEDSLGVELGADQAAAVRAITTSSHQFQAVQGLAGAGKTTALNAAVDAWHASGVRVVGAAPFAAAARKLGDETGIDTRTVASLLTRIDHHGPDSVLDHNTVLLVDEASTLGNVDLDRLYFYAHTTGATVRTVGDPQQHTAVGAHGLWASLVELHADTTPVMDVNRRQNPETMAVVRDALDRYRSGDIDGSLTALAGDGRIKTAGSWPELMGDLVDDWHDRYLTANTAGGEPSQMIAERNRDRAALNELAQARLRDTGVLGAGTDIGGVRFHIGDRVVAQTAGYDLVAPGGSARDHVINGSVGTITRFAGPQPQPDLVVDFDGLGEIRVPHDWVATEVGPGRGGGLAPNYAITSYKAEGQTYDAALGLAAPGAVDRAGMYVTLTRGRDDLAIYSIDPNETPARTEAEIPGLPDRRSTIEALRDSLARPEAPAVATDADPGIAAALDGVGVSDRARAFREARVAGRAIAVPDPTQLARFGPRPSRPGPHQQAWDQAVSAEAVYLDRHDVGRTPDGTPRIVPNSGHQAVLAAGNEAQIAYHATRPLDDLLAARNPGLVAAAEQQFTRLDAAVTRAEQQLVLARNEIRRYEHHHLQPPPEASTRLADVVAQVDRARKALASAQQAPDPAVVAAAAAEAALDWRIKTATESPARYILDALGPRARLDGNPDGWDRAARLIEQTRHHQGLTPSHGTRPGTSPLERAVGTAHAISRPLIEAVQGTGQAPARTIESHETAVGPRI